VFTESFVDRGNLRRAMNEVNDCLFEEMVLSVIEASYIIMLLPPFYENIKKRMIKSPKLYFYDVGLASYLLGIEDKVKMSRDPLRGSLFENMVVMEFVKHRFNEGFDHNISFFIYLR
jgi:predicted AAA+ superfamily ATPase